MLDTEQDSVYIHFCTHLGGISKYLTFNREEHRSPQASMAGVAQTIVSETMTPCTDISEDSSNKGVMLHGAIDKGLLSGRKMFRMRHIKMKHRVARSHLTLVYKQEVRKFGD